MPLLAAPITAPLRLVLAAALLAATGALAGCGVVDVAGAAVDLTVDAVDTTTDIVTAPL